MRKTGLRNTTWIAIGTLFATTVAFSPPALGHFTPGDNFDGRGKLYGVNKDKKSQGSEPNNCKQQRKAGDPVNPGSGEFSEGVTDLTIPGAMPIEIRRTYRSQRQHYSAMFGANWFFAYEYRLNRLNDGNIVIGFPSGEETVFVDIGNGQFSAGGGEVATLSEEADGTYLFSPRGFLTYRFDSNGNLARISRTGGAHLTFSYAADPTPVAGRFRYASGGGQSGVVAKRRQLLTITDIAGRTVEFAYYDTGIKAGRVKSVSYLAGTAQSVMSTYDYDDDGNLIEVKGPVANQDDTGPVTRYSYSSGHSSPNLNHNLLSITAPNEVAGGGPAYLINIYDDQDRVIRQTFGAGDYLFEYGTGTDNTTTTRQTARDGTVTHHVFNAQHQLLEQRIRTRGLMPGTPAEYVFRYTYDPVSGNRTRAEYPSGAISEFSYDARNNIVETRRKSAAGAVQDDLVSRTTYEPRFDRVKTKTDPMGRVTTYFYDYEEATLGDLNGDGRTDQAAGQPVKVVYPRPNASESNPVNLYRYNDLGQLVEKEDALGRVDRLTYFDSGLSANLLESEIADAGGFDATTTYAYDPLGHVTAKTDPRGNTATFTTDLRGLITRSISPAPFENRIDFTYDLNGNLIRMDMENRDADGVLSTANPEITFLYEYDLLDNLITERIETGPVDADQVAAAEVTNGNVLVMRMVYDDAERLVQLTHPGGETEHYEYDERELLTRRILAKGTDDEAVTRYRYTVDGYISRLVDANGGTRRFAYDGFNRKIRETDAEGTTWSRRFDALGNPLQVVIRGANGERLSETRYTYDRHNRMVGLHGRLLDPDGKPLPDGVLTPGDGFGSAQFDYDLGGKLIAVRADDGRETTTEYDSLYRARKSVDHVGNITEFGYDLNGNATRIAFTHVTATGQTVPLTHLRHEYDSLNRRTKTIDGFGEEVGYRYDSRSNLVTRLEPNGDRVRMSYDSLSRLVETIHEEPLPNGGFTRSLVMGASYDGRDRIAAHLDADGNRTLHEYDGIGLLTAIIHPDGSRVEMARDRLGNLLERRDPNGSAVRYSFTPKNLVATRTAGDRVDRFTYDGLGRVTGAVSEQAGVEVSRVERAYTSSGRLVSETQNGRSISYELDSLGQRRASIHPGGLRIDHVLDQLNRPVENRIGGELVSAYEYTGINTLSLERFGNGTTARYTLDAGLRHVEQRYEKNGTVLSGNVYQFDEVGLLVERRGLPQGPVVAYAYDAVGRLTGARTDANGNGTQDDFLELTLDARGSRVSLRTSSGETEYNHVNGTYQPDPLNRYLTIGSQSRTYDQAGNMSSDGQREFVYDAYNRIQKVRDALNGSDIVSYEYDAFGRRIAKIFPDRRIDYAYDGDQIIREISSDGTDVRYIRNGATGGLLQMETGGDRLTYQIDRLGTVMALADQNGDVVERYSYSPFGETTIRDASGTVLSQSAFGNAYQFAGGRIDPETGLYHMGHRLYDPQSGAFLQRDPLGFIDGPNLYLYAGGDPINAADPLGLSLRDWASSKWRSFKRETSAWGSALTYLPGEVASSFMDGRAADSLQGFAYNYGGKYVGVSNTPTYGHQREFEGGKRIANITKEVQQAVIISAATGSAGNWLKSARLVQVCSKGGRVARYVVAKAIDAAADTLADYIMDENGNCWTAEEFLKRFGKNALFSVMGDAAAGVISRVRGRSNSILEGAEDFAVGKPGCFLPGTEIATEQGLKAIEEVVPGDRIWAGDPDTGDRKLVTVTKVHKREVDAIYLLDLAGDRVETSGEHPFWIKDRGWVAASALAVGDQLETRQGDLREIRAVSKISGGVMVHNLTVQAPNTYFVTEEEVLVHNSYNPDKAKDLKIDDNVLWHPDQFDPNALRNGLPVRMSKTDPTHGILWIPGAGGDPNLVYHLKSGRGLPGSALGGSGNNFKDIFSTHVEGHAASIMDQIGANYGKLLINNRSTGVCRHCIAHLDNALPVGTRLDVFDPQVNRVIPFGRPTPLGGWWQ